ncbi:MAG: acyl dehydratase [Alphaproteobacteria bacterium]|jgi:hypothetical protein
MSETIEHSEPYVGKDLGEDPFICTPKMLGDFYQGLKVDPARYKTPTFWDKPVSPAMMVSQVDVGYDGARFENAFGNLWIRQEWEFHSPMFPDHEYRRTSTILDIYEWRNRSVVKQEVSILDGSKLVVRGVHHQSFMLDQTSGKVVLRDPKKKEGVRKFEVPEGQPVAPLDRSIDLEMCGVFFHGNESYHTDKKASEELGFEEVVVGGRMTMSLIGQMLEQQFGQGYYEGGTLDIKFTNIVWPDDHVTAKGVTTGVENGKAQVRVWMEKDDGTVVVVGNATASV